MRARMKTNAQEETEKLVAAYNMGMVSRKSLMEHMGLPPVATGEMFWRRHNRDVDEAAANWKTRLFGA